MNVTVAGNIQEGAKEAGSPFCHAGWAGLTVGIKRCGPAYSPDALVHTVHGNSRVDLIQMPGCKGDSGAPAFRNLQGRNVKAVGILTKGFGETFYQGGVRCKPNSIILGLGVARGATGVEIWESDAVGPGL